MNTDIDLSMIRYYIYIYTYEYICIYISPKIYLLGSGYVLDIPFLTAYITVSLVVALQQYLFRKEWHYKMTYTHDIHNCDPSRSLKFKHV